MKVFSRFSSPDFAVFAIHGGIIEPGTKEIAEAIAGDDLSLYFFEGDGPEDHITSTLYEEPKAIELASKVQTIISIHGEKDKEASFVMVGGLNESLSKKIEEALSKAEFFCKEPQEGLAGINPKNICNKGVSKKGVQLEISRKLRRELWKNSELKNKFTNAIREAISQ